MLEGLKPIKAKKYCVVTRTIEELDKKDAELLAGYIADLDFSAEQLSAALRSRNVTISSNSIRLHRNLGCMCVTN